MADRDGCARCGMVTEMIIHVLRDCRFVAAVWMLQRNVMVDHNFFELELDDWLLINLKGKSWMGCHGERATIKFAVICWLLWRHRNGFVFEQQNSQLSDVVRAVECLASHIWEGAGNITKHVTGVILMTPWQPQEAGWIKINCDGAAFRDETWFAVGGVIRDSNERWLVGFRRYVGNGSALNSELWAILHGLEIANQCDCDFVIVKSDCRIALRLIKDNFDGALLPTIVRKIKLLSNRFRMVKFKYVCRKNNRVADYIVKTCGSDEVELHVIHKPCENVKKLLLDDHNVNADV